MKTSLSLISQLAAKLFRCEIPPSHCGNIPIARVRIHISARSGAVNSLIPWGIGLRRPKARSLLIRQSGGVGLIADLNYMIGFKHILCPIDLTPESDAALRYAVALAGAYEAKLTVCHCAEATSPVDETARGKFGKRVEACIRRWTGAGHCPPADYEGIVIEGNPGEAIVTGRAFTIFRVLEQLSAEDAAHYAAARSVVDWHMRHRFCAVCGTGTEPFRAGWGRKCPSCSAEHFPRVDPVVIMLAEYGDKVLMGRGPGWPPGRYSALAGFVEPGESLEEAVARETFEEAVDGE